MTIQASTTIVTSLNLKDQIGITVEKLDNAYQINWTDFVANDWSETYATLSIAMARVAVLVSAFEMNFEYGFTNDADTFGVHAELFIATELG